MNEQEQRLQQEILDDAKRRAGRLVSRAKRDAAKMRKAAEDEVEAARAQRLAAARKTAEDRYRAITARIRHEILRRWLTRREAALDELLNGALTRLEAGADIDRERSLVQLLHEALAALGTGTYTVRLRPADRALFTDDLVARTVRAALAPEAAATTHIRVLADAALGPGLVLVDADGRRSFDNTYATRLQRLREPLRALVCDGIDIHGGVDIPHD